MLRTRIIPCLLLKGRGLVKTIKFKDESYVGDPINAVKIFNDKAADELILLDIDASAKGLEPNYDLIEEIVSEAFMPVCYGGGVQCLQQFERLISLGVEKVAVNSAAVNDWTLISDASKTFGAQSIVVGIDIKRSLFGKVERWHLNGRRNSKMSALLAAQQAEQAGAGEILLNDIDRDGTMTGYDHELVQQIASKLTIPLIACGGASSFEDMCRAVHSSGASAAAAGSFFVFKGKHRAVLITYPDEKIIDAASAR
jgi:imidazole glycerol-phosphate synthase subunit HisF